MSMITAGKPEQLANLWNHAHFWPLSVEQYERMLAVGILDQTTAVELIDGYLVGKDRGGGPGMTEGPVHATAVDQVGDVVAAGLPRPQWIMRSQHPSALGDVTVPGAGSEPEPDIAVVQGPRHRYTARHPGAADIGLLIEVADTSLAFDRDVKAPAYAAAGISAYWIVNLGQRQLEVLTDPDPADRRYRQCTILTGGQMVLLQLLGMTPVEIAVGALLP